jgi:predicted MFS family arabinose efflux permease
VSGITFAGMGSGITLSSVLLPVLLRHGLVFTWSALGLLCLLATLAVSIIMPASTVMAVPKSHAPIRMERPVLLLIIAYALSALGFVPHMLFLSSFVAIGLHRGIAAGAAVMAWVGVAAALGPVILGRIADRFGFLATLAAGYVVMAVAVGLPLVNHSTPALDLSAIGVGAVALGAVMLAAGAIAGLVPAHRLAADWGIATMTYAVAQALTAAGFSNLFHVTGSYKLLFFIGAASMLVSVVLVTMAARHGRAVPVLN